MTEIDDGGQAFPFVEQNPDGYGGFTNTTFFGMTLRDYFAAQYLAGLAGARVSSSEDPMGDAVSVAYSLADAMIAARKVREMSDMQERALIVTSHMTQSKVNRWASDCQQKFAYSHIHEIKCPPSAALAFGSGWDRAMTASEGSQDPYKDEPEHLNGYFATKLRDGKDMAASETADLFIEAFREEAEEVEEWGSDDKNDLEKQGVLTAKEFVASDAPFIQPVKLQESLQIGIEGADGEQWALTGTLDLVASDEREDGKACLRDIKTAKRRWSAGQAQGSLQAVHYSLLAKHNPGFEDVDIDKFVFDIAVKNKKPVFQHEPAVLDDHMRDSHLNLVSSVRNEIIDAASREYWRPNRGSWLCSRKLCGYWRECEKAHGGRVKE